MEILRFSSGGFATLYLGQYKEFYLHTLPRAADELFCDPMNNKHQVDSTRFRWSEKMERQIYKNFPIFENFEIIATITIQLSLIHI